MAVVIAYAVTTPHMGITDVGSHGVYKTLQSAVSALSKIRQSLQLADYVVEEQEKNTLVAIPRVGGEMRVYWLIHY